MKSAISLQNIHLSNNLPFLCSTLAWPGLAWAQHIFWHQRIDFSLKDWPWNLQNILASHYSKSPLSPLRKQKQPFNANIPQAMWDQHCWLRPGPEVSAIQSFSLGASLASTGLFLFILGLGEGKSAGVTQWWRGGLYVLSNQMRQGRRSLPLSWRLLRVLILVLRAEHQL